VWVAGWRWKEETGEEEEEEEEKKKEKDNFSKREKKRKWDFYFFSPGAQKTKGIGAARIGAREYQTFAWTGVKRLQQKTTDIFYPSYWFSTRMADRL
jgi:hypothetical protein